MSVGLLLCQSTRLEQQLLSRCGSMMGDDGILDCLEHFVERGDYVVLVTGQ